VGKNSKHEIVQPLTPEECDRLRDCEQTIRMGLGTFVAVGTALLEIRDARLYRQSQPSFEKYVQSVLALSRPRAYELIDSSQVMRDLSAIADISTLPQNEGQARELRRWKTPEERVEKWKAVLDAAGDKPVTAKLIRQTLATKPAGTVSPDDTTKRAKACLTRLRGLVTDSPAETKALQLITRLEEIVSDAGKNTQPSAIPSKKVPPPAAPSKKAQPAVPPKKAQPSPAPVKTEWLLPGFD